MERTQIFPNTPQEMRVYHIEIRRRMDSKEVELASRRICERLYASEWYRDCEWIYGYYPLGNEVDCRYFLEQAIKDGKQVALPRVNRKNRHQKEYRMDFFKVADLQQVEEGAFHVKEPLEYCPLVESAQAVVLVPGVVFDVTGNRYGYGKGYYDRYFARFPQTRKFALAYENQMEEKLTVTDTDIKMERIYTEKQMIY